MMKLLILGIHRQVKTKFGSVGELVLKFCLSLFVTSYVFKVQLI